MSGQGQAKGQRCPFSFPADETRQERGSNTNSVKVLRMTKVHIGAKHRPRSGQVRSPYENIPRVSFETCLILGDHLGRSIRWWR